MDAVTFMLIARYQHVLPKMEGMILTAKLKTSAVLSKKSLLQCSLADDINKEYQNLAFNTYLRPCFIHSVYLWPLEYKIKDRKY